MRFGAGKLNELYKIIPNFGGNVLFVIGGSSLKKSGNLDTIEASLKDCDITYSVVSVNAEPSPKLIDQITNEYRSKIIDVVVGIGGGSVTDAGKAISAMLPKKDSIVNYLEGIGTKNHDGTKIPYVAIPTTSGTGSEATKNAVISEIGPNGYKRSLRHDNLIPNYALIDPELMTSCPAAITAACGMDAFTQLLESYVSTNANPMTDALAYSGMRAMAPSMIPACSSGATDVFIRGSMAYGALISGITLANAGLGIVHGLASPIGGFFDIPHGVACGTLLAEATKINVNKLKELGSSGKASLLKHAQLGALMSGTITCNDKNINECCSILIDTLESWVNELKIPRLSEYDVNEKDVNKIVDNAQLKNNPVKLSKEEIKNLVLTRL